MTAVRLGEPNVQPILDTCIAAAAIGFAHPGTCGGSHIATIVPCTM